MRRKELKVKPEKVDKSIDRCCVHFAFKKATFQAIRDIIAPKNISMQKLFESFAESLANKDPSAVDLFNRLFLQETIKITTITEKKNKKGVVMNSLENLNEDELYTLINSNL